MEYHTSAAITAKKLHNIARITGAVPRIFRQGDKLRTQGFPYADKVSSWTFLFSPLHEKLQLKAGFHMIADRNKVCDRMETTSAIVCDPAIAIADDRRR